MTYGYCDDHEQDWPCEACPSVVVFNAPKDCGIHYGMTGGPCGKCAMTAGYRRRGLLQYGGTPWSAVIGGRVTV